MKLIFLHNSTFSFEIDMPQRGGKHRVPNIGDVVRFDDGSGSGEVCGTVDNVEYIYKASLGVFSKTEIEVYIETGI